MLAKLKEFHKCCGIRLQECEILYEYHPVEENLWIKMRLVHKDKKARDVSVPHRQ